MSKALRTEVFGHKKLYMNWRLMLVRVLVNTIVIGTTATIMPGLTVKTGIESFPILSYLALGAAFGLLNAFIKPIVQFLTLSFIFITYGLVIIIIHAIMLLLLQLFMPNFFEISSIWAALVGGFIIGALSMILDNIFGLTPPIIDSEAQDLQIRERVVHTPIEGIGFVPTEKGHVPSYVEEDMGTEVVETAVSTTIVDNIAQAAITNTEEE